MALATNPGVVTNGLIFYYDMNNTAKSFVGKPVTNQFAVPTPYNSSGDVSFAINGTGTFRRIYEGTYGGYTIQPNDIVYRYNLSSTGGCHYHGNAASIGAGQYATFIFDYYISQDAASYPYTNFLANFENYGGSALGGSVAAPNSYKGIWQTVSFTSGPTGGAGTQAMFLYPGACGGDLALSGYVLFKNPQCIFSSSSNDTAPFVNGTRSNTQSVLDLVGQTVITAQSLTYSSNNTFSFKDYGQRLDTNITTFGNNATWEAWINGTSNVSTYNMFMGRYLPYFGFYGANSLFFSNNIGGAQQTIQTATNLSTNTWYHATFTTSYNGTNTTMKIYTNGVETASGTFSGAQGGEGGNYFAVGDGYNASWYRFDGQVASVKIYNRTLTPSEVQQNFNALRGRFGV